MAQQMKKLGIKPRCSSATAAAPPSSIKLPGDAAEGHYCSLPGCRWTRCRAARPSRRSTRRVSTSTSSCTRPTPTTPPCVMIDAMKRANSVEPAKYLEPTAEDRLRRRHRQDHLRRARATSRTARSRCTRPRAASGRRWRRSAALHRQPARPPPWAHAGGMTAAPAVRMTPPRRN
jgi:hypothetical protein